MNADLGNLFPHLSPTLFQLSAAEFQDGCPICKTHGFTQGYAVEGYFAPVPGVDAVVRHGHMIVECIKGHWLDVDGAQQEMVPA